MPTDDPEQQRLRVTVSDEIEAILRRHDLGGVVLLASRTAASWRFIIPTWSFLERGTEGFRLRIRTKTPDSLARTEDTLHMIGSVRDMARDVTELFARFFRAAEAQLGDALEHKPFGAGVGVNKRPDPYGGKVE